MKFFNTILIVVHIFFSTSVCAQWTNKQPIPQAQSGRGGACYFTLNDQLYVLGGYVGFTSGYNADMYAFNPGTNTWTAKTSPTNANRTGGAACTLNGKGYVALGVSAYLSASTTPIYMKDMNSYDATSNTWATKAAFPDSGRIFAASFVLNNKLYVAGGATQSAVSNQLWQYDPVADSWIQKANLPVALESAKGFASATKGYIVGGLNASAVATNKTYEYDPSTDSWTAKADMPLAIQGGTTFVIGSMAYYALGSDKDLGQTGAQFPTAIYQYNMTTNSWSTTSYQFPSAGRMWTVSGVLSGKAYMGCGYKFQSGEFAYKDLYELSFAPNGVASWSEEPEALVYPNPCVNQIVLRTNDAIDQVQILNTNGEVMLKINVSNTNTLDVSKLTPGWYTLQYASKGKTKQATFVKE